MEREQEMICGAHEQKCVHACSQAHTNNYCTLWRLKVISPTSMVTSLGSPVVQYLQIKTTYKIHKSRVEVLGTKAELFSNGTVSDSNKKLITNLSFSGRIMGRFSSLPSV